MSPSSRNFHHRSFEDKAKNYRSRRRQELDRNLDSPDGLRTLVDSLIGDVWRARREAAKLRAAPSPALTRELSCLGCGQVREPSTWDAQSHAYLCVECVYAIRHHRQFADEMQRLNDEAIETLGTKP